MKCTYRGVLEVLAVSASLRQRLGLWRSQKSADHLRERGYGRRWAVESYFSGLKRTMGGAWSARRPEQQLAEAAFRVLAYALRR